MLLIVEDEPQVARILARFFDHRFDVRIAGSANEARAIVAAGASLSAVVVDAGLPEGPSAGLELARELREGAPHLPIALVSGRLEPDSVNAACALGATAMWKPVSKVEADAFVACVERADPLVAIARKHGLTTRETEILLWMGNGGSILDFLSHHDITRSTFNTHANAICRKTGADSVVKLALATLVDAARRQR